MIARFRSRPWFIPVLIAAVLALGGGGYYVARYHVWAAYRNWTIERMHTMARDFIAADDPRNALLTVRKVLARRPNDVEAWRIGVEASLKRDSAEAVHYQRNLVRVERTPASQLELLRLAARYRAYGVALEAIPAAAEAAAGLPEYHRLAADIYRQVNRPVSAKYHLISLLSMEPADPAARLALSEIEYELDPERVPDDWAPRVAQLALNPVTLVPASMLQIREATRKDDLPALRALTARLQNRTDLTLEQRLRLVEAMLKVDAAGAERVLAEVKTDASDRPGEVTLVMAWLGGQSREAEIVEWAQTLAEPIRTDRMVRLGTAVALDRLSRWRDLEAAVTGPRWETSEALRLALLARAQRMQGRTADFAESWKLALIASGSDLPMAVRLLRTVETWRWTDERIDVLWRIFNLAPTNQAVRDELVMHAYLADNTIDLNKIYARIVDSSPNDDEARNNFAYTSLLLDTNLGRAQLMAKELYQKYPRNPSYVTTYALALHKQGDSKGALALIQAMDSGSRARAASALHEISYAAAVGETGRATELLPLLTKARMLPEERRLVARARTAIAQQGSREQRQMALAASAGDTEAGRGWAELLPGEGSEISDEEREAETLYQRGQYAAMVELLQGSRWKRDELRSALVAYARRRSGSEGPSVDAWRQALAAAGRDPGKLANLEALASAWSWETERMDVVARRFERDAGNTVLLGELSRHYREQGRTADLARTLWLHVEATKATGLEAAWCVYYSLLCDQNTSGAQTLARRAYDANPDNAQHRVAYAFALWRQGRAGEAWELLSDGSASVESTGGMQTDLLGAAILVELGRKKDAKAALVRFSPANALPEEARLATNLTRATDVAEGAPALTMQ